MSTNKNKTVSVIIPTYNRQDRLIRTLGTIRTQSYSDLEIIVSDDGSKDNTIAAVEALDDKRIKIITDGKNSGVASARNKGIASATGNWVTFCDDDDYWTRSKVGNQVTALINTPAKWSYSWAVNIDEDFNYRNHNFSHLGAAAEQALWERNRIPGGCSNVMVERALLDEVGPFDPKLRIYADWDMWLRFAQVERPAVVEQYDVLYVLHAAQMTGNTSKLLDELKIFRAKHSSSFKTLKRDSMLYWIAARSKKPAEWKTLLRILAKSPDFAWKLPEGMLKARLLPKAAAKTATAEHYNAIKDVSSRLNTPR